MVHNGMSVEIKAKEKLQTPFFNPAKSSSKIKQPSRSFRLPSARPSASWKAIDFAVGDKVVYPSHGVGSIECVEVKQIMGNRCEFYVVKLEETGMKVMVPKTAAGTNGLRPIVSKAEAEKVIEILNQSENCAKGRARLETMPWNRRFRDYTEKMRSGCLLEMAQVLRELVFLADAKSLSFGEKNLFESAKTMVFRELSLAISVTEVQDRVKSIFGVPSVTT